MLDTGEGRPEYLPVLERALRESTVGPAGTQLVSDIIISHRHHDHHGGLPDVLRLLQTLWTESQPNIPYTGPRIHKAPLGMIDRSLQDTLGAVPSGTYSATSNGNLLHDLVDGQTITGSGASLTIIRTPGHTTDSICAYAPEDRALFTADTILGQGTAVFEDLGLYMVSLSRLHKYGADPATPIGPLYPGHGPVVHDGQKMIASYRQHRLDRENQVLQLLSSDPAKAWSATEIVSCIYKAYPQNLWAAAEAGIVLHLRKLEGENRVCKGSDDSGDTWRLTSA